MGGDIVTRTLILIFAFLALSIGSFVVFVATWDRDAEEPVSALTAARAVL